MSAAEWIDTREPKTIFTPREYLLLERRATEKSEFIDGWIYGMAGASPLMSLSVRIWSAFCVLLGSS